jgi:hypothetical protein
VLLFAFPFLAAGSHFFVVVVVIVVVLVVEAVVVVAAAVVAVVVLVVEAVVVVATAVVALVGKQNLFELLLFGVWPFGGMKWKLKEQQADSQGWHEAVHHLPVGHSRLRPSRCHRQTTAVLWVSKQTAV